MTDEEKVRAEIDSGPWPSMLVLADIYEERGWLETAIGLKWLSEKRKYPAERKTSKPITFNHWKETTVWMWLQGGTSRHVLPTSIALCMQLKYTTYRDSASAALLAAAPYVAQYLDGWRACLDCRGRGYANNGISLCKECTGLGRTKVKQRRRRRASQP